jgi:hypothetical protein
VPRVPGGGGQIRLREGGGVRGPNSDVGACTVILYGTTLGIFVLCVIQVHRAP